MPVLVVLHGYGADEQDLLPIAEELGTERLIISLQAPIPLGGGGYAWYYLEETAGGIIPDELSRHESEDMLVHTLASIIEREGGDPNDILLMGFSQGSAVCYSLVTLYNFQNYGLTVRGVIAMSGYLPRDILGPLTQKDFARLPMFLAHGEDDPLIPSIALEEAEDLLSAHGANVTAKLYPTVHAVHPDTVGDVVEWLGQIMNDEG